MGDGEKISLKLKFDLNVRLAFRNAAITSGAGLLACRELDDALSPTESGDKYLKEGQTGKDILHHLILLLRHSVDSRLTGYYDSNDAERLSQGPAMRVVVAWQCSHKNAASTVSRFEAETLTQEDNLQGLARMNTHWVEEPWTILHTRE
jgi:hypothetical protein